MKLKKALTEYNSFVLDFYSDDCPPCIVQQEIILKIQKEEENDWFQCDVKAGEFQGYGGPKNLGDLLRVFLNWAEANQE